MFDRDNINRSLDSVIREVDRGMAMRRERELFREGRPSIEDRQIARAVKNNGQVRANKKRAA